MTQDEHHARQRTQSLKNWAREEGFLQCRVGKAEFLQEEAPRLEKWLREGKHGKMGYMENHFDLRLDPSRLVPGARSVVTLLYNYFPEEDHSAGPGPRISKYAFGQDYHDVIRKKLKGLLAILRREWGQVEGRVFVDSAPVLEKALAARNGSGWVGKHTNLVHPKLGSFFFLAELILLVDLEPDPPMPDYCGTCTRCVDACPTDALHTPYQIDATRCISYLTIELREAIPADFSGKMENWAFGCDICQDVCPWNKKFSLAHQEPAFQPGEWTAWSEADWQDMTEDVFGRVFGKSALRRTGYSGLKRNLAFGKPPQISGQGME